MMVRLSYCAKKGFLQREFQRNFDIFTAAERKERVSSAYLLEMAGCRLTDAGHYFRHSRTIVVKG